MCEHLSPQNIYELAQRTTGQLRNSQEELKRCRWRDGESNLDTHYSTLASKCCEDAWDNMKQKYPQHSGTTITCTSPDVSIIATYFDSTTSNHKIELKSSKNKTIPGSTIGELDENQPVIFYRRPSPKIKIQTL